LEQRLSGQKTARSKIHAFTLTLKRFPCFLFRLHFIHAPVS